MRRVSILFLAFLCFIVGVAFIATPIPLGAPLFALSLVLIVASSRSATRLVTGVRIRAPLFDRGVGFLERRAGRLGRTLRKTSPRRYPRRPVV
ncbi:hypothetical protein J2R99_000641 [Rhodopseudomonas julia]|uniref:Transmembrane protein (PGPGW) n=1 Tax=Rhodopseudomonas julia TaxID=200617 RepID=A0ABU0C2Q0_9BRAD|nr:hypothetical protein [Rhodopseudomonas julia]MDQ0324792.1 hypothetical protein [Rhodopseudomonas julia]